MIGHEAVRETANRRPLLCLRNQLKESSIVTRVVEEPQSPDAPIQNMEDNPTRSDGHSPGHPSRVIKRLANMKRGRA